MLAYYRTTLALIAALLVSACGGKQTETTEGATESDAVADQESVTKKQQAICMWKELSVRETPDEKGKYMTAIYLGEKITFLGDTASDFSSSKKRTYDKVELLDGSQGWVRDEFIAINAVPAAAMDETVIYKRPDIMTASGKSLYQMDFVAIKSTTEDGWAEITGKRRGDSWFTSGWVKSENLTTKSEDVATSVFYQKAMELTDEAKRSEAIQKILQNPDLNSSMFHSILAGTEDAEEFVEEEPVEEQGE